LPVITALRISMLLEEQVITFDPSPEPNSHI